MPGAAADWQDLPNSLLDALDRQQQADGWAQQQRTQVAQDWGDLQRQIPDPQAQQVVPTTAELSGGGPRTVSQEQTGNRFMGLSERGTQIMRAAGDHMRSVGFDDDAVHAVQSVLLTEGGLDNARGDYGASAGPLQFYFGGGQGDNFARAKGLTPDDAKGYLEQNPNEAIQWAIGTPDNPGYLGAQVLVGQQRKGLTGPDLATFIQRTGQVSVSPERAGANHNLLFGSGQDPFSAPITAGAAGAINQPTGADAVAAVDRNARIASGLGAGGLGPTPQPYANQFQLGLNDADAYAACYDGQTRVLTRRGFVHFRELTDDDELATRREDGLIEYHRPLARQRFYYAGRMIHFRNLSVDLLVTPDHQLLAFSSGHRFTRRGKVEVKPGLVPAEQIAQSAHGWSIPVHSWWSGSTVVEAPVRATPEEWAAFVGLWLAEGHVEEGHRQHRVGLTQAVGSHTTAMRRILDGTGVEYATLVHRGGPASRLLAERYRFTHRPIFDTLKPLGKSPERFVPRALLQASPEVLNALLMGLWLGDGSKAGDHTVYTTTSKQLAEDVAELGVKLGMGAVIRTRTPRDPNRLVKYDVSLRSAEYYYVHPSRGAVTAIDDWEGEVFCATVPNHTLLVERNGKITWCGNCGPAAAIAFAQRYGRNPTADEAMQLAKASGWTQAGGMNGVANEQALLNSMGVSSKLETTVNWSRVGQEAANGNPVIISTPGHYFYVDDVQEDPQGQQSFHVGGTGTALKGGAQWMSAADMQRLMGKANGALYADHPLAEGPSLTESQPPAAQPDTGLGGAFAALGQKKDAILSTIGNIPLGVSSEAGPATTVGDVASAVPNALRMINPMSAASRTIAGSDQWAREYAAAGGPDLEQELQNLQSRRVAGDDSVLPRIQQIGEQLNAINAQISGGKPAGEATFDVAERNPNLPALEAGANLAGGLAAIPLSAEAMPIAAKTAAEVLAPGSNVGNVVKALGAERQVAPVVADAAANTPRRPLFGRGGVPGANVGRNPVPVPTQPEDLTNALQQTQYQTIVNQIRKNGWTDEQIATSLRAQGVPEDQIQSVLHPPELPTQPPSGRPVVLNEWRQQSNNLRQTDAFQNASPSARQAMIADAQTQFNAEQQAGARVAAAPEQPPARMTPEQQQADALLRRYAPELYANETPIRTPGTPPPTAPTATAAADQLYGPTELGLGVPIGPGSKIANIAGEKVSQVLSPTENLASGVREPIQRFAAIVGRDSNAAAVTAEDIARRVAPEELNSPGVRDEFQRLATYKLRDQASRDLINTLQGQQAAWPANQAPAGWRTVTTNPRDVLNNYAFPPDVARSIAAVISPSAIRETGLGQVALGATGGLKQSVFGLSNMHNYTEGITALFSDPKAFGNAAGGWLSKGFFESRRTGEMANDFVAAARDGVTGLTRAALGSDVERTAATATRAVIGGVGGAGASYEESLRSGDSQGNAIRNAVIGGVVGAVGAGPVAGNLFARLWDRAIPLAKVTLYRSLTDSGMDGLQAAQTVNQRFGGLNYAQMGRSQTLQDAMRLMVMAPDWNESTIRTIGSAIGGNKQDAGFVARTLAGTLIATEALNFALNGQSTAANENGHQFEVLVGRDKNGKGVYMGLGPGNIQAYASLALKRDVGSFVENRLGPLPQAATTALTGAEYIGGPQAKNRVAALAAKGAPIGVSQAAEGLERQVPPADLFLQTALGPNLRYGREAAPVRGVR